MPPALVMLFGVISFTKKYSVHNIDIIIAIVSVCTCVVHKRCHKLVITKCPGMRDEVRYFIYNRASSVYYFLLACFWKRKEKRKKSFRYPTLSNKFQRPIELIIFSITHRSIYITLQVAFRFPSFYVARSFRARELDCSHIKIQIVHASV